MLAGAFIVIAAIGLAILAVAVSRVEDPAVRLAGRFAPAIAVALFISVRELGIATTEWILFGLILATAFGIIAVLFDRDGADLSSMTRPLAKSWHALRTGLRRRART